MSMNLRFLIPPAINSIKVERECSNFLELDKLIREHEELYARHWSNRPKYLVMSESNYNVLRKFMKTLGTIHEFQGLQMVVI